MYFYLLRGGGGPSKMVEEGFFITAGVNPRPTVKREILFPPFRLSPLAKSTSPDRGGLPSGNPFFGRTHRFAPTELKPMSVRYCRGGYYPPVFLPPQRRRGTIEDGGGGIFYYGGSKPPPYS